MTGDRRYYWLKLNEKFFEGDTVAWLEEQKNGKDYIVFYLKLCLKSLQDDGNLIRYVGSTLIPYDVPALAKLTNTNEDTVAVAMKVFSKIGLIEIKDTGEIYLSQINELIGSETDSARRKRKQRSREKNLSHTQTKQIKCDNVPDNVQKCPTEYRDIEYRDIEYRDIDKDIDKDINKYIVEQSKENLHPAKAGPPLPYQKITDYLNKKTNRNFSDKTKKTRQLIKARFNEGFTLEDFKKVIDIKTRDWLNDKEMNKYLRPETLFGNKFEGYLNQETEETGVKEYEDVEKVMEQIYGGS